jgi:hypothetical protein
VALVLTNIRGDREREVAPKVANIWLRFSLLAQEV